MDLRAVVFVVFELHLELFCCGGVETDAGIV